MKIIYKYLEVCGNIIKINKQYWQYGGNIIDFPANEDTSYSFAYKENITGRAGNDCTQKSEVWVPLKSLNFWRIIEISVINCVIDLILTWSEHCVLIYGTIDGQLPTFAIILCSTCIFIDPRKCKTVKSIEIRF